MSDLKPGIASRPGQAAVSQTKNWVSLTLFALGAFGILIALGVWQLDRRVWKNDLIARFEDALSKPPADYEPPRLNSEEGREFKRVKVSGVFHNSQMVRMLIATPQAARAYTQEGFGYLIFTPLEFENGTVFVNRGFVPLSIADAPPNIPSGKTTVTGIVRLPQKPGWFTPASDPVKRLFHTADIQAMAAAAGVGGNRVITAEYIEAEKASKAGEWPMGRDPRELLAAIPNSHLEYALTWFALAATLVAFSGFYIART
jgi:surfeit locus 1 family protein